MIRRCEWTKCQEWAQWRASYPDKSVRWLCEKHKQELQKYERADQIKFIFVGAVADGLDVQV